MPTSVAKRSSPASPGSPAAGIAAFKGELDRERSALARGLEPSQRRMATILRRRSLWQRFRSWLNQPTNRAGHDHLTVNRMLGEWEREGLQVHRTWIRHEHLFTGGQAHPLRLQPPVGVHVVTGTVRTIRQLPVILGALVAASVIGTALFMPATPITGMLASRAIPLERLNETEDLLRQYVTPFGEADVSDRLAPVDITPFQQVQMQPYMVQKGDSIEALVKRFGVPPDAIISANNLADASRLVIGTTLLIPNRPGLVYKARKGDTLSTIAARQGVGINPLLDANNMDSDVVLPGQLIFIPGARMDPIDVKLITGEMFNWPTPEFRYTSPFGYRPDPFTGVSMFHNGIDLAAYIGAPVRAASAGTVILTDPDYGTYGRAIMIRHARGFVTLYGHLNSFNVQVGQYVRQGDLIARMGNTGKSTGPHVHFSIIKDGVWINPLKYLPNR